MSDKRSEIRIDWGDGKIVSYRPPRHDKVPGARMICPKDCYPVGITANTWLSQDRKGRRKNRKK